MLQNQRVRRQPMDEDKLAELDLDNTDFDDNIELPDFTMETETIEDENEDAIFREESQETGGDVLDLTKAGKNAKAMHAYNEKINQDIRMESVLLPLRDGIMISRKK